jgi:NodT family efflux transporter outer membrane factor (OMF) lipoprotein
VANDPNDTIPRRPALRLQATHGRRLPRAPHVGRPAWHACLPALAVAALLSGCVVGPDFKPPDAPAVADPARAYSATPLPTQTAGAAVPGGAAQRLAWGQDVPALWWQLFKSPALDELIRSALAHSPTLASAQAALRQAQELYEADAGSKLYPQVSGKLGANRAKFSEATSPPNGGIFNLFNASVDVSYTFDLFGATKRELEGLQAQVDYQRFQVSATYLSLSANIVTTAIQEASLRAQLQATHEIIDSQAQALALVRRQAELGAIAMQPVLAQQTQLAQAQATVPALEKALGQTRHQLALLAGRLPGEDGLPEFTLESLHLPQELPLSLPSALVRQRPDIQASEALLHAASAQVGVATANLYPQVTLSASAGFASLGLGNLFSGSSPVWSVGAGLLAPIFNGGALNAQKRAAEAAYDQARGQYQQTVLGAFRNVADALRAIESDALALQAQAHAADLARQSLELVNRQYAVGALNYLALIDAQLAVQQTRIALVQAQAARYADSAALLQALGGGWWNAPPLELSSGPAAFAPPASQASK